MSQHGSASGASATESRKRQSTVKDLIGKTHDKLGHSGPLSLTEHLSAAKTLRSIRDRIAAGERLDQKTQVLLMCTGIACYRRWSVGDVGIGASTAGSGTTAKDEAAETRMNEEARELVRGTAARLFVLLCMAEKTKDKLLDVETAQQAVATAGLTSVWAQLRPKPVPKKKHKKQQRGRAPPAANDGNAEMEAEEGGARRGGPARAGLVGDCDAAEHGRGGASCLDPGRELSRRRHEHRHRQAHALLL